MGPHSSHTVSVCVLCVYVKVVNEELKFVIFTVKNYFTIEKTTT